MNSAVFPASLSSASPVAMLAGAPLGAAAPVESTAEPVARVMLAEKAVVAVLTLTGWSARKLDKRVTREATEANGAKAEAGRFNKRLIAGEVLKKIEAVQNEARTEHYRITLPWLDSGARILPAAKVGEYDAAMRGFRGKLGDLLAELAERYPAMVAEARTDLGEMFNESDYPTTTDVVGRFTIRHELYPVPDNRQDFRVQVGEAARDMLRAEFQRSEAATLARLTGDVAERITKAVGRMAERLNAYKPGSEGERASGTFHDTLVSNVAELAELIPSLNVTNDPRLAALAERMRAELIGADADTLRQSDAVRATTAKAAESILADVSSFFG